MYTIFINDTPIYLTDSPVNSSSESFFHKDEISIEKLLDIAKSNKFQQLYLYCTDLKLLWLEFKWFFKIEKAAGGLVKNNRNEILFIYRFDTWDLPKGKIEKEESKKEAAIREVEEECGITGLKIQKKLQKTYHLFQRKNREVLKITYWYSMSTTYSGSLKPQIEEGITDVVFKNKEEVKEALEKTYGNIKLLFENM
ncbi:MAG: 8-oxo-dGTP pyrophosphatase MutT (NUDIX family) [Candidatus Azotimanducaceae bacterium]|jgi:8-oxo-dGTP pyrophosphatase MutT (NUDIX family)